VSNRIAPLFDFPSNLGRYDIDAVDQEDVLMTNILVLTGRSGTQPTQPKPDQKPEMSWVIDPATGRPVMTWSLPQPAMQSEAA
jgi:hypothetical protein